MSPTPKASNIINKFATPAMSAAGEYALECQEKLARKKEEPSVLKSLIPGAAAGAIGTVATAPLDRIKDTMTQFGNQAARAKKLGHTSEARELEGISKNLFSAAKHVYKSQGAKGFYKGLSGAMLKMPIAMGITFAASDYLKKKING